jgi:membrane protein involved in colicin uptake
MSVVFGVYKEHKDALRAACWDHSKSTEKAYLGKASIRLGPTGKLVSVKTEGTDDIASACVDKQIKKWKFPPPNGTATIVLPIHMHRD